MDDISKKQYKNLRTSFNNLVTQVLGEDYYNMGHDVYQCDQLCCADIIHKVKTLKQDNLLYKRIAIITIIVNLVLLGIFAYIGLK